MPSGIVHQRIYHRYSWTAYILTIILLIEMPQWGWFAFAIPIGWHLGAWIDPDLDMKNNVRAKAKWRKTIIFLPLVWWWQLYALLCSRWLGGHRSLLTHLPLVSSSIRLTWFLMGLSPIFLAMSIMLSNIQAGYGMEITITTQPLWRMLLGLLLGMTISDTVHVLADIGLLR